ncbi:MAG: SCP2 sterol-binding domain-containing protein [Candidatus Lokiarchaeota archaeon]|nr:SCP2 sterol-binding domain-containing protein [Candidatus Lokiarchaeota archaeon]
MTEFKNIDECLEEIKNRYNNNEKVRKKLAKYDDPIQMSFLDTEKKVLLLVNKDEGIEIKDNTGDDSAPVKIEFTGEQVMIDLFNKNLGAVKAYSDGKIKIIEGSMRSLMKLRSLMF